MAVLVAPLQTSPEAHQTLSPLASYRHGWFWVARWSVHFPSAPQESSG
jgi:hypothetical protein